MSTETTVPKNSVPWWKHEFLIRVGPPITVLVTTIITVNLCMVFMPVFTGHMATLVISLAISLWMTWKYWAVKKRYIQRCEEVQYLELLSGATQAQHKDVKDLYEQLIVNLSTTRTVKRKDFQTESNTSEVKSVSGDDKI